MPSESARDDQQSVQIAANSAELRLLQQLQPVESLLIQLRAALLNYNDNELPEMNASGQPVPSAVDRLRAEIATTLHTLTAVNVDGESVHLDIIVPLHTLLDRYDAHHLLHDGSNSQRAGGFITDIIGHLEMIQYARLYQTADAHKAEVDRLNNLIHEVELTLPAYLVAKIKAYIDDIIAKKFGGRQILFSSTEEQRIIEKNELLHSLEKNCLEYVRPKPGRTVYIHRTSVNPEQFFRTGLGFTIDLSTTATTIMNPTSDDQILESISTAYSDYEYAVVLDIPTKAVLTTQQAQQENRMVRFNTDIVKINDASEVLGTVRAERLRLSHLFDPQHIRGVINRKTGEFIVNPLFAE